MRGGLQSRLRQRPWQISIAVAVALFVASVWLIFSGIGPDSEPALPYEESLPAGRNGQYARLDHAIFSALEKSQVQPESLRILRRITGRDEVSEIMASTKPGAKPEEALVPLSQAAAGAGADCTIQKHNEGGLLVVSLQGKVTHRIILRPGGGASGDIASKAAKPMVALVVDDMGYGLKDAKRLAALDLPMTFSILPHAPHGPEVASVAQQNGLEVMLHLPMEPAGYPEVKPGPGALLVGMSRKQISRLTRENLSTVPFAKGVNNHMGSVFCTKKAMLEPVFRVLKQKGLFFLDSRTSPHTQALATARLMGLPSARRDVFVDHDHSPRAIDRQLRLLLALAKRQGHAIAILHPYPSSIKALERWRHRLQKEFRLVEVSALVQPPLKDTAAASQRR